jgi:2'-5' RNA ligase
MYAIASLLDPNTEQEVRTLWQTFEDKCGLTGIKNLPLPHFTWMAADSCHFPTIEALLDETAKEMPSFQVRAAGIGVFTGTLPVVYINLVKDPFLLDWHRSLWQKARPFLIVPSPFYHPDRWMPHITLAYQEVDPQQLGCAILDIAYQRMEFSFTVNNLALISHTFSQNGIRNHYSLQKEAGL